MNAKPPSPVARTVRGLLLLGLAWACAQAHAAPVVANGGFESGSAAGWTVERTVAIASVGSPYAPLAGGYSALLVAESTYTEGGVAPCDWDIWNVGCPRPLPYVATGGPTLTYDGAGPVRRGGQVGQDLSVRQFDELHWDWLVFGEATHFDTDFGYFQATNATTNEVLRFSTGPDGHGTFVFDSAGIWSVRFYIAQYPDNWAYSAMLLDGVELRAVPAPGSLALAFAALVAAGVGRRLAARRAPAVRPACS